MNSKTPVSRYFLLGTLRNHDGDCNENVTKQKA